MYEEVNLTIRVPGPDNLHSKSIFELSDEELRERFRSFAEYVTGISGRRAGISLTRISYLAGYTHKFMNTSIIRALMQIAAQQCYLPD
ncbi:hypothetical protein KHS38_15040 [Mucilaginibacter sp. Bleaf8]|uniref:hypothetical protein n=1 Tax=Mucilaginibacter sp. Bleaf8 TaxID=2834430 RepID=UPI001BCC2B80|nr:hypothetical protein [Mucilaginibacter sp. Bleaf8]MBS7565725.1 hypothetical protein [Mucilaginibacter sp. Bleaf8]